MAYMENPSNFDLINSLVKTYDANVQREIIKARRCFVIDACSFEFYKKVHRREAFTEYIKANNACVVIFRTILMELAGDNGLLEEEQIDFIEYLFRAGVSVYVLYEEDIFALLQIYTDNKSINQYLKHAVLCIKQPTGIINNLFSKNESLKSLIVHADRNSDASIYQQFFQNLRGEKQHEDNLGEIVCLICIHIMANMEEMNPYKYVFLTEDTTAVILAKKVIHNSRRHRSGDTEMIGTVRATNVIEKMYKMSILKDAKEIEAFLDKYPGNVRVLIKVEYEPEVKDESLSIKDFAKFICEGEGHIIL